jgi:hypothetical protein
MGPSDDSDVFFDEVLTAVKNVNEVIAPKFFGKSVLEQADLGGGIWPTSSGLYIWYFSGLIPAFTYQRSVFPGVSMLPSAAMRVFNDLPGTQASMKVGQWSRSHSYWFMGKLD